MTGRAPGDACGSAPEGVHTVVLTWYAAHARALPWREPGCSPWSVFVSEIMAQQTPVARVVEPWREWLERWPSPAALAVASPADVIRAWGRLGYPRRAVRLREAAIAMVSQYGGAVPASEAELLRLPGVGRYTAAAVAAFAFGERTVVVDTNVRRLLARVVQARAQAASSLTVAESRLAAQWVPTDPARSVTWNVAAMELGALVCTARRPRCDACPLTAHCRWYLAGSPDNEPAPRRSQQYEGTDRQVRGRILQALRDSPKPLSRTRIHRVDPAPERVDRLLGALISEGLIESMSRARFRLPLK